MKLNMSQLNLQTKTTKSALQMFHEEVDALNRTYRFEHGRQWQTILPGAVLPLEYMETPLLKTRPLIGQNFVIRTPTCVFSSIPRSVYFKKNKKFLQNKSRQGLLHHLYNKYKKASWDRSQLSMYDTYFVHNYKLTLEESKNLLNRIERFSINRQQRQLREKYSICNLKEYAHENAYSVLPVQHFKFNVLVSEGIDYVPHISKPRCKACKSKLGDDCPCVVIPHNFEAGVSPVVELTPHIISLMKKIRVIIRNLRGESLSLPTNVSLDENWDAFFETQLQEFQEMGLLGGADSGENITESSNVVIEQESTVERVIQLPTKVDWIPFVSTDVVSRADAMTNRYIEIGNFVWTKDKPQGTVIYEKNLPCDVINAEGFNACHVPNYALFNVHAYSCMDLSLKFLVNSSPYQTGSLMIGWIYQYENDAQAFNRRNVWTMSQTNFATIYAGEMNEVEFKIPFRHSVSMLFNQKNPRILRPLNMGRLMVMVVNPLIMGGMVSDHVNIDVQMKFDIVKFTGMRHGGLPAVQMYKWNDIATTGAMRLLDTVLPDPNRDNPPLNLESPYFVPTASHSWSAGTGRVDMPKILRLDTRGQTHHPPGVEIDDAFTIDALKRKKGLMRIDTLSTSIKRGKMLFDIPAEPMFGKKMHFDRGYYEIAELWNLPPVSALSSCFCFWRGTFHFEVDIVCSKYHTFKLLFAYIPNAPSTGVTMELAQASSHVIVSVDSPKKFIISVPFISPTRYYPRTYTGNFVTVSARAPSHFYCFMNNPVLLQESAADKLYMNIYVKGGDDFELVVPVQPSIGLGNNYYYFPKDENIKSNVNNLSNIHWWIVSGNTESTIPIMGYGEHINSFKVATYPYMPQFDFQPGNTIGGVVDYQRVISIVELKDRYIEPSMTLKSDWDKVVKPVFGILVNYVDKTKSIMVLANSEADAVILGDYVQTRGYKLAKLANLENLLDWKILGKTKISELTPLVVETQHINSYTVVLQQQKAEDALEFNVGGAIDNKTTLILNPGLPLMPTGYGHLDFGECFNDLLTLCRRYQLYGNIKLTKDIISVQDKCSFFFTVNPQGLGNVAMRSSDDPSQVFNRCREGIIPILLSAYRYFRGGLRFRLVFPACKNTLIWIQHRPDRPSRPVSLSACKEIKTAQAIYNHGYASELQLGNLNSIVEFEVPFYQMDHYGLLQDPAAAGEMYDYQYGLGQIVVGLQVSADDMKSFEDKYCDIYYSIADDFSPSVFYGFPRMLFLDDVPQIDTLTMQMGDPEPGVDRSAIPSTSKTGIFARMVASVTKGVKDDVKEVVSEEITNVADQIKETITEHATTSDKSVAPSILISVLTNLAHCLNAQNFKAVGIAIVSILSSIGALVVDQITFATELVGRIMKKFKKAAKLNESQKSDNVTQGPEVEDEEIRDLTASWVTLIYGAISSLFVIKGNKDVPSGKKVSEFLKNFSFGIRGATSLTSFVKGTFAAIKQIYQYCKFKFNPNYRLLYQLKDEKTVLDRWIKECLYLVDPHVRDQRYSERTYCDRVYAAHEYGQIFVSRLVMDVCKGHLFAQLNKLFNNISEIKAELIALGEHPHIRKEPFGVYMYGSAGSGKSYIREEVCIKMLKAINYKFVTPDIFCIVNADAKHWNQCKHQPVLVLDDLWNIQVGERLMDQVSMIYQIFSSTILNPPKAAVEDKSLRYNPDIVWMNSNYASFSANGIHDEAVNRRRDILVRAAPCIPERKIPGCAHCDGEEDLRKVEPGLLKDYHHMQFFFHNDKLNPEREEHLIPFTYEQMVDIIVAAFVDDREKEAIKFNNKLHAIMELIEENENVHVMNDLEGETFSEVYIRNLQAVTEKVIKIQEEYEQSWTGKVDSYSCKVVEIFKDARSKLKLPRFFNKLDSQGPDDEISVEELGKKIAIAAAAEIEKSKQEKKKNKVFSKDPKDFAHLKLINKNRKFIEALDNIEYIDHVSCSSDYILQLSKFDQFVYALSHAMRYRIICKSFLTDIKRLARNYNLDLDLMFVGTFIARILYDGHRLRQMAPQWKTVYDYIQAVLKLGVGVCEHMSYKLTDVGVLDNILIFNGRRITENCEGEPYCIMRSRVLRAAFYSAWLRANPIYCSMHSRGDTALLPFYLQNEDLKNKHLTSYIGVLMDSLSRLWTNTIMPAARAFGNFIKKWFPILVGMLTVIFMVCGIKTQAKVEGLVAMETELIKSSPRWNDFHGNPYEAGTVRASPPRAATPGMVLQASQQSDAVEKIIQRNTCFLIWHNPVTLRELRFRCMGIVGHHILVLRHYVEQMRFDLDRGRNYKLYFEHGALTNQLASGSIELDVEEFLRTCKMCAWHGDHVSENHTRVAGAFDSNLCVALLPGQISHFKNLLPMMARASEVCASSADGKFVFGDRTSANIVLKLKHVVTGVGELIPAVETDSSYHSAIHLVSSWNYGVQKPGYCGSMLLSINMERPIVGVHVAGSRSKNIGIGEILYVEIFESLCTNLVPYVKSVNLKLEPVDVGSLSINGPMVIMGKVKPEHYQRQPTKTKIKETLVHGVFPVSCEPVPISPGDRRLPKGSNPLHLGVAKHGILNKNFDREDLRRAYEDLRMVILREVHPVMAHVDMMSYQDVVCGIEGEKEFKPLAWNTSAGYPLKFSKPHGSKGKQWLFSLDCDTTGYRLKGFHPLLEKQLSADVQLRQSAVKQATIFIDCLKDECISKEKCLIPGKARIFSVSPIQYTIEYKRHFGHFMASYHSSRFGAEHAIGIDPESLEWNDLSTYLIENSTTFVVGDYSNFGPSINLEVAKYAADIFTDWNDQYGSFSINERMSGQILQAELLDRYHLMEDIVYRPPSGLPSGGPSTDILNSLSNSLYLRVAWLSITGKTFIDFHNNVRLVTYGDDVIMTVTDKYKEIFNSETLERFFLSYDIKFTDALKTGLTVKYRDILECDFLKRKFVPHPFRRGIFIAQIALPSINKCLNWHGGGLPEPEATETNIQNIATLLYGHGPEIYEKYVAKIREVSRLQDLKPKLPTWFELDKYLLED